MQRGWWSRPRTPWRDRRSKWSWKTPPGTSPGLSWMRSLPNRNTSSKQARKLRSSLGCWAEWLWSRSGGYRRSVIRSIPRRWCTSNNSALFHRPSSIERENHSRSQMRHLRPDNMFLWDRDIHSAMPWRGVGSCRSVEVVRSQKCSMPSPNWKDRTYRIRSSEYWWSRNWTVQSTSRRSHWEYTTWPHGRKQRRTMRSMGQKKGVSSWAYARTDKMSAWDEVVIIIQKEKIKIECSEHEIVKNQSICNISLLFLQYGNVDFRSVFLFFFFFYMPCYFLFIFSQRQMSFWSKNLPI